MPKPDTVIVNYGLLILNLRLLDEKILEKEIERQISRQKFSDYVAEITNQSQTIDRNVA